eukprot:8262526-Ditylum_brightwellii.AAC.1
MDACREQQALVLQCGLCTIVNESLISKNEAGNNSDDDIGIMCEINASTSYISTLHLNALDPSDEDDSQGEKLKKTTKASNLIADAPTAKNTLKNSR